MLPVVFNYMNFAALECLGKLPHEDAVCGIEVQLLLGDINDVSGEVLFGREDQRCTVFVANLLKRSKEPLDCTDPVHMHFFILLFYGFCLVDASHSDPLDQSPVLLLCHERACISAISQVIETIGKHRLQSVALHMVELSLPVHFAQLPVADVDMAHLVS